MKTSKVIQEFTCWSTIHRRYTYLTKLDDILVIFFRSYVNPKAFERCYYYTTKLP